MPWMAQIRVRTTALLLTLQHSIISTDKGIRTEMANIVTKDPRRTVGLWTAGCTLAYGISLFGAAPRDGFFYPAWVFLNGLFFPGAWALMMVSDAVFKVASILKRWRHGEIWAYLMSAWMWWSIAASFVVTGVLMPGLGLYVVAALTNSLLVVWTCTDTQNAPRNDDAYQQFVGTDSNRHHRAYRVEARTYEQPHFREAGGDDGGRPAYAEATE